MSDFPGRDRRWRASWLVLTAGMRGGIPPNVEMPGNPGNSFALVVSRRYIRNGRWSARGISTGKDPPWDVGALRSSARLRRSP